MFKEEKYVSMDFIEKNTEKFKRLRNKDISKFVERKGNLNYLSWAKAWELLKEECNDVSYTVYENEKGYPYFTDGRYVWVKVGVTVDGVEHKVILHVMNNRNLPVAVDVVDIGQINKTIMRCLTKAIAFHGIGLGLYIGEDIQEKPKISSDFKIEFNEEMK